MQMSAKAHPGAQTRLAERSTIVLVGLAVVTLMGNLAWVETGIAEGMRLVLVAERAYRALDGHGSSLRAAAEHTHYNLLRAIYQLTEEEADRIEPAFTQFEDCLARFQHVDDHRYLYRRLSSAPEA